jgi:hypothetical protein
VSESSRLRRTWSDDELVLFLDMYFNGHMTDSHNHDEIARFLGRYNPRANKYRDGGVNQKIAEIKGYVEPSRARRHPGRRMVALIRQYEHDHQGLRARAVRGCRTLLRRAEGPIPEYVARLLRVRKKE